MLAVLEELDLKREVFAELDRVCRPEAVLATNTSALSVAEIAEATQRPERVVGMHFFNPAPVLPLVEIVRAPKSSDEAVTTAYEWAVRAGKEPEERDGRRKGSGPDMRSRLFQRMTFLPRAAAARR